MLRELAPGRAFDLITLSHRTQGLLVPKGNPWGAVAVQDLAGPGVRLINRQRGAGTRLLLDQMLQRAGLDGSALAGYDREEPDAHWRRRRRRLGRCRRRARHPGRGAAFDLDFVPLARERYELALAAGDL